jgi:membrane protease YdiL (CAAX protease family)
MRTHWPSSVAIAMNAALFGLAHIFYPPAFVILVGVLGAIFALAFERTGAGYNSALVTAVYLSLAV